MNNEHSPLLLALLHRIKRALTNISEVLSDCETLIKAIRRSKTSPIHHAIVARAKDEEMSSSKVWCELRHYMARLYSYRDATEVIVDTSRHCRELFQDFTVDPIASSAPMARPITGAHRLTAAEIIRCMTPKDEDARHDLLLAEEMQKFELDSIIYNETKKNSFAPIVHAEILVYDYLSRHDITKSSQFWNECKYIGSSKPTCRLCKYYFDSLPHADGVEVRSTHGNLYLNWRLPDLPWKHGATAVGEQILLFDQLTRRVQIDARRTLQQKVPHGKQHDSDTHSLQFYFPSLASSESLPPLPPITELAEDDLSEMWWNSNGSSEFIAELDALIEVDFDGDDDGGVPL